MFDGYPLRKYGWKDWLTMIISSSLIMQVIVVFFATNLLVLGVRFLVGITLTEDLFFMITYYGTVLGAILSLPLTLWVVHKRKIPLFNRKGLSKEESLIIRGVTKEDWIFLAQYIPTSYFVYTLTSSILSMILGPSEPVNQIAVESLFEYIPVWLMFIMIVIVAPITEELLFRGLLLFPGDQLDTGWIRTSISAVLFGIVHTPTDFLSFYTYVGMGFIFSYASKRTQTIEAAMIYHFLNNLFGFLVIAALR